MLRENRFSRYLVYAIGEIVLVVIGILIALQVNNWNQQMKNDRLETGYYCRLLEDLQQDVEQNDRLIEQATARLKASNQAIRLLQQEGATKIAVGEQMGLAVKAIYVDFKPSNSTFEDLRSSNLNIIKDKDVIKSLNDYYNNMESLKSIIMVNGRNAVDIAFAHDDGFATGGTQASLLHGNLKNGLEQDVYDALPLDTITVLTDAMRTRLLNEALVYVSSNARQLELYNTLKEHTARTVELLRKKC